jgi:hypothetical protein
MNSLMTRREHLATLLAGAGGALAAGPHRALAQSVPSSWARSVHRSQSPRMRLTATTTSTMRASPQRLRRHCVRRTPAWKITASYSADLV